MGWYTTNLGGNGNNLSESLFECNRGWLGLVGYLNIDKAWCFTTSKRGDEMTRNKTERNGRGVLLEGKRSSLTDGAPPLRNYPTSSKAVCVSQ